MTLEEYKAEKKELERTHQKELSRLARQYAYSNNPFEKGDLVEDHMGTIAVEDISYRPSSYTRDVPYCVYYGTCITKAGKPFKSGQKREVHQVNLKKG